MDADVSDRAVAKRVDRLLALGVFAIVTVVGGVFAYSLLGGGDAGEPATGDEAAATTLPETAVLSQRVERPADGSWVTVLGTIAFSEVGQSAEELRLTVEGDTGLPASVLRSDEYSSLQPGDWIVFHDAGCADEACAAQVCATIGDAADRCHAQLLSSEPALVPAP